MTIFVHKRDDEGEGKAGEINFARAWQETESALLRSERFVKASLTQRIKYHGPAHSEDISWNDDYGPENPYGEYISLVIPRIIFDNPRVKIGTKRAEAQREVAKAVEVGMNRWIRDNNVRRFVATGPAVDMLFNWGIALVEREEQETEHKGKTTFAPKLNRIAPDDYFEDPLADDRAGIRFNGHRFRVDKDDLEERAKNEEGWNLDVVKRVTSTWDYGDKRKDVTDRGEVEVREIFVPELETDSDEENVNGTILTLVASSSEKTGDLVVDQVREPRAFYGPRWGPYTVFGVYSIPDDTRPLAPLQMAESQMAALNDHAKAADYADRKYKRLVLIDDQDPKLQQRIKSGIDLSVIPVKNLTKESFFQAVEVGGASPTQMNQVMVRRDRVDRTLGMSEAKRGSASGDVTATAEQIASTASDIRIDFVKQQLTDALIQVLRTVAWYLYHDNRVAFPLGDVDDLEYEEGLSPWFEGGTDEKDGEGASFDDLELDIEPYSMERANEGLNQQRAVQSVELVSNIAQIAPTAPYISWKLLLDKIGDAMNTPELGEVWNQDLFEGFVESQMQQEAAGEGGPAKRNPRLQKPSAQNGPKAPMQLLGTNAAAAVGATG